MSAFIEKVFFLKTVFFVKCTGYLLNSLKETYLTLLSIITLTFIGLEVLYRKLMITSADKM